MSGFLPHIAARIELNADVAQVLPQRTALVALADGRRFKLRPPDQHHAAAGTGQG
jgi:hypothetical protein